MSELDFANIYNPSGKVLQVQYAQKLVDNSSTIIALSNSKGAVMVISKPITSKLYIHETDQRIKRISENIYLGYTGIQGDGNFVYDLCRKGARNYKQNYNTEISNEKFREVLRDYLYLFTQHFSLRVIGCNFVSILKEKNQYTVLSADCSGNVLSYKACAVGSGKRRAQTELEKLDFESLNTEELVHAAVRILYRCHDPLNDPEFSLEVGVICEETQGQFVRFEQEKVLEIVENYKRISIDDEE